MSCHENIIDSKATSAQAQKMHAHYTKLQGTSKELKCVSCHVTVGHGGELRNYLEYWKPTYKIYEKKMMQKRIDEKQKFFFDYELNADEKAFLEGNKSR